MVALDKIDTIAILLFENRSFDHVLGHLSLNAYGGWSEVEGLVDLGATEMTLRAVTKVRPGSQAVVQNEYRRLLKQVMDERREAAGAWS